MSTVANQTVVSGESEAAAGRRVRVFWYFVLGLLFGFVLIRSEAVSWFRIQEMFRFQSFHMYGLIVSAVAVAALSIRVLRRLEARAFTDELIAIPPKITGRGHRYWIGGSMFGMGWALTGACPGPLFALVAGGPSVYVIAVLGALAGTWAYGSVRAHLPHY